MRGAERDGAFRRALVAVAVGAFGTAVAATVSVDVLAGASVVAADGSAAVVGPACAGLAGEGTLGAGAAGTCAAPVVTSGNGASRANSM